MVRVGQFIADRSPDADGADLDYLVGLAPFVSRQALSRAVSTMAESEEPRMDQILGLAPFLDKRAVAELHQKLQTRTGGFSALMSLAPFLPTEYLDELFLEEAARASEDGAQVQKADVVANQETDKPS